MDWKELRQERLLLLREGHRELVVSKIAILVIRARRHAASASSLRRAPGQPDSGDGGERGRLPGDAASSRESPARRVRAFAAT